MRKCKPKKILVRVLILQTNDGFPRAYRRTGMGQERRVAFKMEAQVGGWR